MRLIYIKERIKEIGRDIKHFKYRFKIGVQNLFYFLPIIWKFRDWDYTYVWEMELASIKKLRMGLEKRDLHTNNCKYVQQMKDCEYLLKRLIDDEYWRDAKNLYLGNGIKKAHEHEKYMYQQDMKYLARLKGKHMNYWWD